MSDDISSRSVKKFDGTNFQGWKFQISALFLLNGIQDVVDGTRMMPADQDSNAAKAWVRDDAKAKFIISSAMEYSRLEPLLVCKTAKEMWTRLTLIHEQRSAANKLMLTQKFHEYKMAPGESVVQHMAKVQNMGAQLLDLGETVTDVTIMAKILASLSSKYSTLQTAWDSVDPESKP